MLVNCFLHNTDDHLRNHGFVRGAEGWRLSPAFDLTVNRSPRLVLAPAAGISPKADPSGAFAAYPAFQLSRGEALAVYAEVVDGLRRYRDALALHKVSSGDVEVIGVRWAALRDPPRESALPGSPLVRASAAPGKDFVGRLLELGVVVDLATHDVRPAGRGIKVIKRATGSLDNTPGFPARVRDAWGAAPLFEYFEDGKPVAPPIAGPITR
jgi:hypothetical protein